MTTGLPPSPTFRSIFGGIALVVILLIAFLFLGDVIKYVGAMLTFIPAKLGLIQVVTRAELVPVDMSISPSSFNITKPGRYTLFTDNYDLLVINDAVIAASAKPWLKINPSGNTDEEIKVILIERGLAIYDTPLAKGRPVASFEISEPGTYSVTHPRRPATAYIVPDYTGGKEGFITFLMILQVAILIFILRDIWATVRERRREKKRSASVKCSINRGTPSATSSVIRAR